jgi:uncharacterized tellurite resistance protein B-like protein
MQSTNFQLGLLHFAHLLISLDGHIDDRERAALLAIKKEEKISDTMFIDFQAKSETTNEHQIYADGAEYLNACPDDEKLAAFVHLYKLAEADTNISSKEVKFLLYGLTGSTILFEDVVLTAGMSGH